MLPQQIIRAKRAGLELSADELAGFIAGLGSGSVDDCQAAAFAMAVCFNGMSAAETAQLTKAMAQSGRTLHWDEQQLGGPVLDKHSTGGVGDKTSIALMPILASCGAYVPMVSGRGLGHTGGTLDKLAAIPGYQVQPDAQLFIGTVTKLGGAIVGADAQLAPADRRLYAIRDATATVDSIPLITASILAKKHAAGIARLVMDVKVGSGAFMPDRDAADGLTASLLDTAASLQISMRALLTDMNQVLGTTAGNALELREALALLVEPAQADARLLEVTLELAGELLVLGKLADDQNAACARARRALDSGAAAEVLSGIVAALGGPRDLLAKPERHLAAAPVQVPAPPRQAGTVAAVDARAVGMLVVELGGGRRTPGDSIDLRVGLSRIAGIGAQVGPGGGERPLAIVHARDEAAAHQAAKRLRAAVTVAGRAPQPAPCVLARHSL